MGALDCLIRLERLAKLPEDRSDRWELVRQIAASYRNPDRDFKAEVERTDALLATLRVAIPAALRE